jgi:predicted Zn-dependent protease
MINRLIIILLVMSSFFVQGQSLSQGWETYADTLVDRQDYAGAVRLYTKIIEQSKLKTTDDYRIVYKRAYAYYGAEEFDKALLDINQYLARIPDPQARIMRAYIYQGQNNYKAQLEDINAVVAESADNAELIRWRASVYMEAGNYTLARKDIQYLLEQQPDPDLEDYLGLSYHYGNDPDSALVIYDQVIVKYPAHVQTYLYAGSLCLEQEAYPLALQYINKGLSHDPSNATLLFYKGTALAESDRIDEGCSCLRKAFAAGIDDAGDYLEEYCYRPRE